MSKLKHLLINRQLQFPFRLVLLRDDFSLKQEIYSLLQAKSSLF